MTIGDMKKVVAAAAWQDRSGSVELWCTPDRDRPWTMKFWTLRTTKAGRPTRKSHFVYGRSIFDCEGQAEAIISSLAAEIEQGRTAWRAENGLR